MSKINLGNFDRIEIYETRAVRKTLGSQLVHWTGIAVLAALVLWVIVLAHFQVAELYGVDTTWFLSP